MLSFVLSFSTEAGVPTLTEVYLSLLSSFCRQLECGLLCPSAHPFSSLDGPSAAVLAVLVGLIGVMAL